MSIEGQGHFFTMYFPGFVCFSLYKATISGERLQDHWFSGLLHPISLNLNKFEKNTPTGETMTCSQDKKSEKSLSFDGTGIL